MVYTKCCECGVALEINENDYMPGCRESEEVICPKCKKVATTVRTSGFPTARVVNKEVIKAVMKQFDMD